MVDFFFKEVSSQSQDATTRFERPILNIRQLETALNVPYRAAERYVERLEEIGILREATGQARKRLYRADEIIHELESAER